MSNKAILPAGYTRSSSENTQLRVFERRCRIFLTEMLCNIWCNVLHYFDSNIVVVQTWILRDDMNTTSPNGDGMHKSPLGCTNEMQHLVDVVWCGWWGVDVVFLNTSSLWLDVLDETWQPQEALFFTQSSKFSTLGCQWLSK